MYVETGTAIIEDTLVASNSLTGISVVREGFVRIGKSDIILNGTEPIEVADALDIQNLNFGTDMSTIRGGILDMGGNKYERRRHYGQLARGSSPSQDPLNGSISYREEMRPTPHYHIAEGPMSVQRLQNYYRTRA